MATNKHQRHFRLYIGNGNWITLPQRMTDDLLKIYERGVAARYQVAPGLVFDIIPNDMDCNSRTASLPKLMRADLGCVGGEGGADVARAQQQQQQHLSRWAKQVLETQGTVDAFPPLFSDRNQTNEPPELPRVTSLDPHRHLHLVPSLPLSAAGRRKSPTTQAHITCDRPSINPSMLPPQMHQSIASSATDGGTNHHAPTAGTAVECVHHGDHARAHPCYWPSRAHAGGYHEDTPPGDPFISQEQQVDYHARFIPSHGSLSGIEPAMSGTASLSGQQHHCCRPAYSDSSCDMGLCGNLSFPSWPLLGAGHIEHDQQDLMVHGEAASQQQRNPHLSTLLAHAPHEQASRSSAPSASTTAYSASQPPSAAHLLSADDSLITSSSPKNHSLHQCSGEAVAQELAAAALNPDNAA